MTKIEFPPKQAEYSLEDLQEMEVDALVELRNLIAGQLGAASIRTFKDKATAVEQTWKALERYDAADEEDAQVEEAAKKQKKKAEPKERKLAKSAMAGVVKRPTREMFATIKKIGEHKGSEHGRAHRWPNYKDGMTIVDIVETEGTERWDVQNWINHGIMEIVQPTDEEYVERRAAWFKKEGREDPEITKEREKKEKEEAKAKADAEAKETAEAD